MIPLSIEAIDEICISVEQITLSPADLKAIETVFSNLSAVKYLNYLKNSLYQDHTQIDLKTYSENKELYALQQVFVKGGINVIETLLQIHKNLPTQAVPGVIGADNVTGNTGRGS